MSPSLWDRCPVVLATLVDIRETDAAGEKYELQVL
jgi:hypothetical protein